MDQGVDADLLPDHECQRERAHADPCHRAVADVDGVGAGSLDELSAGDALCRIEAARWIDLHADDERLGCEPLRKWCGRELLRWVEVDRDRGRGAGALDPGGGRDRLQRGTHGRDVRRRGAATAADVGHPEVGGLAGEGREVFRGGEVEEPTLNPRRKAGVGLARQRKPGLLAHGLQHLKGDLGPDPAVDADDVDARPLQRLDHLAGFLRAQGEAVFGERHLGHDRQVGRVSRGGDRGQEFGQVGEGLQHQEVGPAFEEGCDLFFEGRRRLGDADAPDRLELLADRADRAGQEDRLAGDLAGLASQLDRPNVDVTNPAVEAMAGELDAVGAEGIGLDQLGAGGNVRSVDFLDDFGLREIEFVEGTLEADAARVELGAHGPVAQQRPPAKPLEEGIRSFFVSCHGPQ